MARHDKSDLPDNVLPFKQKQQAPKVHWLIWVNLALIVGMYIIILGHYL